MMKITMSSETVMLMVQELQDQQEPHTQAALLISTAVCVESLGHL